MVVGVGSTTPEYKGTASVVSGTDPAASPVTDQPMRFSAPAMVDPQLLAGEPGVAVAPDGRVYVAAPWGLQTGTSLVWRSDDGGRRLARSNGRLAGVAADPTNRMCAAQVGGGDVDVAVDRTGRVYFADLGVVGISAGASVDHGSTWSCQAIAGSGINDDRPWITAAPSADGAGPGVDAYPAYVTFSIAGQPPGAATVDPTRIH